MRMTRQQYREAISKVTAPETKAEKKERLKDSPTPRLQKTRMIRQRNIRQLLEGRPLSERVAKYLGLIDQDGVPTGKYDEFVRELRAQHGKS